MPRRTKVIAIALSIIVGVGAALVFRKTSPPSEDTPRVEPVPAAPREMHRSIVEKPAPSSHLIGKIEPPAGSGETDMGAGRSAGAGFGLSASTEGGYSPLGPAGEQSTISARGATFSEERRHKVVDGDTLTALAQRYQGSSERSGEIYELNRDVLASADLLPIGKELRIPAATPAGPAVDRASSLPMVPVAPRATSEGPTASASRTYRVKRNDTLTGIARQVYGDARRYRELLDANRGTIARPEDLREGTVLVIP